MIGIGGRNNFEWYSFEICLSSGIQSKEIVLKMWNLQENSHESYLTMSLPAKSPVVPKS